MRASYTALSACSIHPGNASQQRDRSLDLSRADAKRAYRASSLQGQHAKACTLGKVVHFPLYTFRHTCLTRWAPFMDPWTLAYLAGHRDMSITKRYVHPQEYNT